MGYNPSVGPKGRLPPVRMIHIAVLDYLRRRPGPVLTEARKLNLLLLIAALGLVATIIFGTLALL